MNKERSKRQRLHSFLLNVSAFALVFLLLGTIVLQLFNQSAYQRYPLDPSRDQRFAIQSRGIATR